MDRAPGSTPARASSAAVAEPEIGRQPLPPRSRGTAGDAAGRCAQRAGRPPRQHLLTRMREKQTFVTSCDVQLPEARAGCTGSGRLWCWRLPANVCAKEGGVSVSGPGHVLHEAGPDLIFNLRPPTPGTRAFWTMPKNGAGGGSCRMIRPSYVLADSRWIRLAIRPSCPLGAA